MRSFVKFKPGQQGNRSNNRRYGEIRYEREMSTWRPFRYCGLMASFCAMLLGCVAAWSRHWVSGREFNIGIWDMCFYNETEDHTIEFCLEKRALWQTSVIGLMIMSLAFGPLATVLSIFGLCSTSLQKKIYYFNSAGEIYLICGLSSLAALIVYSVAIEIERKMSAHSFGYAFGLCCGSTGFFLVAALCMCVDDVVQTVTNIFCKSDNDDDDDVRV